MFNSEGWIHPTVQHIIEAVSHTSSLRAEIIIIDDGSTDQGYEEAISSLVPETIVYKVIKQENKGRYLARKRGVEEASFDNILFIDSRVFIEKSSLKYLENELAQNGPQIWNGHVNIDKKGNVFARFWDAIVCIAWRRYFRKPKKMSFGIKDFDHFPKGTGFFFVPKQWLRDAMHFFESGASDLKFSSDDTLLIRFLAERYAIHLSPKFSCIYHGRSTFKGFLKHAYNRGQFFVDGFLRPGTRFFVPLLGVLLLSMLIVALLIIVPIFTLWALLYGGVIFVLGLFIGALVLGVIFWDALALAVLGLPFALVYLAGIWRGVTRKVTT